MAGGITFLQVSVALIFFLTMALAIMLTNKYRKSGAVQFLFWSAGLWLFAIGVLLEILFAFGVYNLVLGDLYLVDVVLIVEALAIGSLTLVKRKSIFKAYFGYVALITAAVLISLLYNNIGNILVNRVVYGILPLWVVITSTMATFPAAIIIVVVAALSYIKKRSYKMLSIIAGVIIVSVAGTLYIVQFPAFLYYSEFIGILLLWLGFV